MRCRPISIRLVALIVLLTAASDYSEFDRVDLSAPMNSAGPESIGDLASRTPKPVSLHATNLPDDQCLFCSPWITPQPPALSRANLSSRLTQSAKTSLASRDPILIELPPRA
jgi:hypothetical protein